MKNTTLETLIVQLDNEIKKVSLGGITYYGLMQARLMANILLNENRKEIESAFESGAISSNPNAAEWYFMTYIDND